MTDDIKLPAFPDESVLMRVIPGDYRYGEVRGYTIGQMAAYARAAVLADRERMKKERDALLKDKARLDKGSILIRVSNGDGGVNEHHYSGKDLREAIDAARSKGED